MSNSHTLLSRWVFFLVASHLPVGEMLWLANTNYRSVRLHLQYHFHNQADLVEPSDNEFCDKRCQYREKLSHWPHCFQLL